MPDPRQDVTNPNQPAIDRLNAALQTDPEWQALISRAGGGAGRGGAFSQAFGPQMRAILQRYGMTEIPEGYHITGEGVIGQDKPWLQKYGPALIGAGLAAVPFAIPAIGGMLGGGGAAAGGGAATGAGGAGAAAGGGAAAGATAAGAGGGFLSTLSRFAPLAQNVGQVLGNAAGYRNDARQQDAANTLASNNQTLNQYGIAQNAQTNLGALDLDRKKFDETSEASRYRRALVGQMLGNMQDVSIDVPGIKPTTVTGGVRPSALGQAGRDISADMVTRALSSIGKGNQYQHGQLLPQPTLQTPPSVGGGGFLDTAALISSLVGSTVTPQRDYTKIQAPTNSARDYSRGYGDIYA